MSEEIGCIPFKYSASNWYLNSYVKSRKSELLCPCLEDTVVSYHIRYLVNQANGLYGSGRLGPRFD